MRPKKITAFEHPRKEKHKEKEKEKRRKRKEKEKIKEKKVGKRENRPQREVFTNHSPLPRRLENLFFCQKCNEKT